MRNHHAPSVVVCDDGDAVLDGDGKVGGVQAKGGADLFNRNLN